MTERQADGQASYQFVFSAFYPVVCPSLQDHPFLESHTMQVHKPFILFPSIHLTEEPKDILEAFNSMELICCQELMDLYLWETGCT